MLVIVLHDFCILNGTTPKKSRLILPVALEFEVSILRVDFLVRHLGLVSSHTSTRDFGYLCHSLWCSCFLGVKQFPETIREISCVSGVASTNLTMMECAGVDGLGGGLTNVVD